MFVDLEVVPGPFSPLSSNFHCHLVDKSVVPRIWQYPNLEGVVVEHGLKQLVFSARAKPLFVFLCVLGVSSGSVEGVCDRPTPHVSLSYTDSQATGCVCPASIRNLDAETFYWHVKPCRIDFDKTIITVISDWKLGSRNPFLSPWSSLFTSQKAGAHKGSHKRSLELSKLSCSQTISHKIFGCV